MVNLLWKVELLRIAWIIFFRIALNSSRIANHLIHNTYNMYSNDALINRLLLMVNASWLMAQGSLAGAPGPARVALVAELKASLG